MLVYQRVFHSCFFYARSFRPNRWQFDILKVIKNRVTFVAFLNVWAQGWMKLDTASGFDSNVLKQGCHVSVYIFHLHMCGVIKLSTLYVGHFSAIDAVQQRSCYSTLLVGGFSSILILLVSWIHL